MKNIAFKRLTVIGVGLIGGSLALDLKRLGAVEEVVGVGRSRENLQRALELGVVDRVETALPEAVDGADLIFLATPVGQIPLILKTILPFIPEHALITDAGSTKSDVASVFREQFKQASNILARAVPAHPIAGSDLSGASAARYGLYAEKTVVVTPLEENAPECVQRVDALWRLVGARTCQLSPDAHDAIFSAVSHLPHLLAFAYISSLLTREDLSACLALAGSGFRDFSRIAASHPEMWRDIALSNKHRLLDDIEQFSSSLDKIKSALLRDDAQTLSKIFFDAQQTRAAWPPKY